MRSQASSEPEPIGSAAPPPGEAPDTETLELLASWQREDATSDPDQIRAAERELADFKRAMNDARAISGEPVLYP